MQETVTALDAVDPISGLGASAVQMGRSLLADPDFCLKTGIARSSNTGSKSSNSSRRVAVGNCDAISRRLDMDAGTDADIGTGTCTANDYNDGVVNVCDRSNRCIIGATMALTPLRCMKYQTKGEIF